MADSRIRLHPRSTMMHADREIYVGWDNVLQTYYAHVIDGQDEHGEERRTVDLGGDIGEITYPGGVIAAVRPYAEIPEDLGELLNISRVSTTATFTDLRTDSRSYQHEQYTEAGLQRLYRPDGFVTELTRDEVTPALTEHGWTATDVHATQSGHTETYQRDGQELALSWGWPDQHHDSEHLLSPVQVDGERYGVSTRGGFESVIAEGNPGSHTLTPGSEERVDSLVDEILASHEETQTTARQLLDEELDDLLREDPPADDDGFHSGLGT
jgi:hypothetical protein